MTFWGKRPMWGNTMVYVHFHSRRGSIQGNDLGCHPKCTMKPPPWRSKQLKVEPRGRGGAFENTTCGFRKAWDSIGIAPISNTQQKKGSNSSRFWRGKNLRLFPTVKLKRLLSSWQKRTCQKDKYKMDNIYMGCTYLFPTRHQNRGLTCVRRDNTHTQVYIYTCIYIYFWDTYWKLRKVTYIIRW